MSTVQLFPSLADQSSTVPGFIYTHAGRANFAGLLGCSWCFLATSYRITCRPHTHDYDALLCTLIASFSASIYLDEEAARPGLSIQAFRRLLRPRGLDQGHCRRPGRPGFTTHFPALVVDLRSANDQRLAVAPARPGRAGWLVFACAVDWQTLRRLSGTTMTRRIPTPLEGHEEEHTFYFRLLVMTLQTDDPVVPDARVGAQGSVRKTVLPADGLDCPVMACRSDLSADKALLVRSAYRSVGCAGDRASRLPPGFKRVIHRQDSL